jgi:hypothetical protein
MVDLPKLHSQKWGNPQSLLKAVGIPTSNQFRYPAAEGNRLEGTRHRLMF